ncbi:MAG: hypothetical protein AAB426_14325 [Myxococcota bacterium]
MRRYFACWGACLTMACQAQLHGTGELYVWNGTLKAVTVRVAGRSPAQLTLFANGGQLLDAQVAGTYQVHAGDGAAPIEAVVREGKLTLVNLDGVGCFVRADVSGMYRRDRSPAKVLEVYANRPVIDIDSEVRVFPGESLPAVRPKTVYTFQRLTVIDCSIARDESAVERYLRTLR